MKSSQHGHVTQPGVMLPYKDSILRLQYWPVYKLFKEEGPPHDRTYTIHLFIDNTFCGKGVARSKIEAKELAAREYLKPMYIRFVMISSIDTESSLFRITKINDLKRYFISSFS